jgi:hypothetical protein
VGFYPNENRTLFFSSKKTLTMETTTFTFDLVTREQQMSISRLGHQTQAVVCVVDLTPPSAYSRAWKAFAKLGTNQEEGG